ncbi:hypothetical protein BDQ17DRAFT_796967 [Cyathus striatus]|nr:hypothetical protein BDQ17DRAFT_796967 [Cyathus striatus]
MERLPLSSRSQTQSQLSSTRPHHPQARSSTNESGHGLSIKKLGKKKVIRNAISKKIKAMLGLIVARGADVHDENNHPVLYDGRRGWQVHQGQWSKVLSSDPRKWKIVLNEDDVGEPLKKWILPAWTYACNPNLEIYQMPLPCSSLNCAML